MKHPVKTLAALACLGAVAPSVHAVSIKDDVLSLGVGVRLQTRAQMSDATAQNGSDYRVEGGEVGAANDPLDFYIRRARMYLKIKYGSNWKGELAFAADNVDRDLTDDDASTATANDSNPNRGVQVRYAWIERAFKIDETQMISVGGGLNKPQQNASDARMSSSRHLFTNGNHTAAMLAPRGVGVWGRYEHPLFAAFVDVQNNQGIHQADTATSEPEEQGFYYGARVEFSFSPDWFTTKRSESYVAKEGQALVLGLSYSANDDDVDQTENVSTTAFGIDVLFWMNGLTAFAEYRAMNTDTEIHAGGGGDVDGTGIVLQAAYAFPLADGTVFEPALRYQIRDDNTDNDNEAPEFGNMSETGGSGDQIDFGINYYLDGHDNKLSLNVSLWTPEDGDADATIIRLQHQLNF